MIKGVFSVDKLGKKKIDKLLELRVNTVFVGHKNLIRDLVNKLRNKNIKIYVEVSVFAGKELWQEYPAARPVDENGRLMKRVDWYAGVCPNHPKIRKERLYLIKSIIKDYDIDGIWLDFIRYPCHWEVPGPDLTEYCFCSTCLGKFSKEIGGRPAGKRWIKWKCNRITSFVTEVWNLINQGRKEIKLGIFSVPWREEDFNGAITKVVGQDFKSLAKYIDIFSPMVYHKMCGQTTKWIHGIISYMNKVTGKPTLPIIQTEDRPEKISVEEFREEINEAVKKPSKGVIIFFLEDLLRDKNKNRVVKEIFK